jgi:hypothetical protein
MAHFLNYSIKATVFFLLPLLMLVALSGCRSSAEVAEEPEPEPEETEQRPMSVLINPADYNELRISPAARLMTQENRIPAVFITDEEEREEIENNSGFRIQLLTTNSITEADSMSLEYYDWLGELERGRIELDPVPDAYITFRQPYYRVRLGDFKQRSAANAYLRIVRDRFPGAWVVIDTIDPNMVPETTTEED